MVAHEKTLLGLRVTDAALMWSADLGAAVSAPLVWQDGRLVAVLENGDVVVLHGGDGLELWRYSVSGQLDVRPSVAGSELFLPVHDGRILAFEVGTGQLLWERLLGGSPQEILAVDDLFVGATDNYFYRLSRSDGKMRWRWRAGGDIVGLPAVDVHRVIFVSLDNLLWALDRKSGVQQWRRPLSGRPTGGPQIVADMVLVSGLSPIVYAFDTDAGRQSEVLISPGELAGPPYVLRPPAALAPGLIVMTGDGRLVGYFRPTEPVQSPVLPTVKSETP
jgi:outer membrane protein assembly factor BamB